LNFSLFFLRFLLLIICYPPPPRTYLFPGGVFPPPPILFAESFCRAVFLLSRVFANFSPIRRFVFSFSGPLDFQIDNLHSESQDPPSSFPSSFFPAPFFPPLFPGAASRSDTSFLFLCDQSPYDPRSDLNQSSASLLKNVFCLSSCAFCSVRRFPPLLIHIFKGLSFLQNFAGGFPSALGSPLCCF